MLWIEIKYILGKIWTFLKKIPGWVFFVLLVLVGLLYFYINRVTALNAKIKIQDKRIKLEKEKQEKLREIDVAEVEKIDKIHIKYDLEIGKLKEKEKELNEAAARGPIALAEAWKEYLARK